MKKKKFLPFVSLLLVCAALGAGYSALSSANAKKEAQKNAEIAAENALIPVAQYDPSALVSISYKAKDSDPVELVRADTLWQLGRDANFPVNQNIAASMASSISSIMAKSELDSTDNADFGLAEPAYVINVKYADGTSHEYKIGEYNSFAGGSYYFTADGQGYTIPTGLNDRFAYDESALMQNETMPADIEADYLNSIALKKDGTETVVTDSAELSEILDVFKSIRLGACADYYADAGERASSYGINGDDSVAISYKKAVTVTDESGNPTTSRLDTTYTLNIGSEVGHDEGYYVSQGDSAMVYIISSDSINKLLRR